MDLFRGTALEQACRFTLSDLCPQGPCASKQVLAELKGEGREPYHVNGAQYTLVR